MTTTRKRWMATAGAAAACVAVIAAGTVAANAAADRGTAGTTEAAGMQAGAPGVVPSAPPSDPVIEPAPERTPFGDVVDTGLRKGDARFVLYAVRIDGDEVPGTSFGVMLGRRLPDGTLTADVIANEVVGSDRAPGFHAVQGPTNDGHPTFGYYAGPATRITAKAGNRTVTAKRAVWSEDPRVVLFWFAPAKRTLTDLTAYDSEGRKLPAGSSEVGFG